MSSPAAFDAIKAYLDANWTATDVVYENERWKPSASSQSFLFVEIYSSFFDQASIGGGDTVVGNLWREEGTLYIHVMVPNDTGTSEARTLAKQAIDLFRGIDLGAIRFRTASLGAGEPGEKDGNYYRMSATIEWERDE